MGVVIPLCPDMIQGVIRERPAWRTRPIPGEPGIVKRRSYCSGGFADRLAECARVLASAACLRSRAVLSVATAKLEPPERGV
jgi:hypothetical protein